MPMTTQAKSHPSPTVRAHSVRGAYLEEDWQIDFTKMPPCRRYKYLLVLIDRFAEWIEALLTRMRKATEVAQPLLKERIH